MSTKRKQYTPEQRTELHAKIASLRAKGYTVIDACKEAGIKNTTYVNWTSRHKVKPRPDKSRALAIPRQSKPGKANPQVLNMFVPSERKPFVFIVGDSEQMGQFLHAVHAIVKGGA